MSTHDTAVEADRDDDTATEGPVEAPAEEWKPSPRPRRWSLRHARGLVVTIVLAVVVFVLLAVAGGVLWVVGAQQDNQRRDDAITVAARTNVLALLTLDPANVQGSLDKVLAGSTGGWRQQFAQNADQFTQVVRNGQVRAQATISASAIQSADDGHATVLVSANAMIANSESPQGYPAVYRTLMNLENQDGQWLVSDLQFVA